MWPETFAGRGSPASAHFGKWCGRMVQPVRAGLTAQLTGWAENGPCYRSGNAWARLCGDSNGRGEPRGAAGLWLQKYGAVLQAECLQGVDSCQSGFGRSDEKPDDE